jgi:hypothetical protein
MIGTKPLSGAGNGFRGAINYQMRGAKGAETATVLHSFSRRRARPAASEGQLRQNLCQGQILARPGSPKEPRQRRAPGRKPHSLSAFDPEPWFRSSPDKFAARGSALVALFPTQVLLEGAVMGAAIMRPRSILISVSVMFTIAVPVAAPIPIAMAIPVAIMVPP